jgi:hypothetical protein
MPALLGQDCVPDWLMLLNGSYKTLRDACARLLWGAARLYDEGSSSPVQKSCMDDFCSFICSPLRSGLYAADGSVSLAAFAAVCALTAAIDHDYVLSIYDSVAAIPRDDKPVSPSSKRKRSDSNSKERTGCIGEVKLAKCTHLLCHTIGSGPTAKKPRCQACVQALIVPIHEKIGMAMGAGPCGRMPDELMNNIVRVICDPAVTRRRSKTDNYMTRLSPSGRGAVLRQVVVCATALHRSYHSYVIYGDKSSDLFNGNLEFPSTLVFDALDGAQLKAVRQILEVIVKHKLH